MDGSSEMLSGSMVSYTRGSNQFKTAVLNNNNSQNLSACGAGSAAAQSCKNQGTELQIVIQWR